MKRKCPLPFNSVLLSIGLLTFNVFLTAQEAPQVYYKPPTKQWSGVKPALVLKKDRRKIFTGKIIEISENGVTFDAKRESMFFDPPPSFYPVSDISILVDKNGRIIFDEDGDIDGIQSVPDARETDVDTLARQQNVSPESTMQLTGLRTPSEPEFSTKIRISADYGFGYLTAKIATDVPSEYKSYVKELKSGTNFCADVAYFFHKTYGLGFTYMKFNTSNFMNNAPLYDDQTNEILGYGYIEDNISMSFIGPTLYERVKILSDKILIVSNVTLGRIHHHNEARIDYVSVLIKGNTFGISGLLGLDYLLNDNFSIGVDISTLTGKFSQYEINGQKMDLAEDDNVNRWNFNIGLRMFN